MKVRQGSIGKADSAQHMLHYISQYNNRMLGKGKGAHIAWARPAAGARLDMIRGVNKGKGES